MVVSTNTANAAMVVIIAITITVWVMVLFVINTVLDVMGYKPSRSKLLKF